MCVTATESAFSLKRAVLNLKAKAETALTTKVSAETSAAVKEPCKQMHLSLN